MATLSWKSSTLLTATLLVAFGLQAGAVKILINLDHRPDAAVPAGIRALPTKPTPLTSNAADAEQRPAYTPPNNATTARPPMPAPEPMAVVSDPPPASAAPRTEAPRHAEPSPEARLSATAVAPTPPPVPATALSDPPPPDSNPRPMVTAAITPPSPPVAVEIPAAKPVDIKPAEPVTITEGLRDAAWLKNRESKNFTVQLYSGKDLDKLKEIAASISSGGGPQAYFTTGSRSTPWYSLVVGDYPDGASARAAAAAISAQSPQIKPWVRRFDDIQTNLR